MTNNILQLPGIWLVRSRSTYNNMHRTSHMHINYSFLTTVPATDEQFLHGLQQLTNPGWILCPIAYVFEFYHWLYLHIMQHAMVVQKQGVTTETIQTIALTPSAATGHHVPSLCMRILPHWVAYIYPTKANSYRQLIRGDANDQKCAYSCSSKYPPLNPSETGFCALCNEKYPEACYEISLPLFYYQSLLIVIGGGVKWVILIP